ncbi:hypothetical protein MHY01S_20240 [Meiothermus hypogaeus NBRC 106114]|uniref:Uncharacterized protein n=1 Tax=Meiothermus hypogaeus NBRC 106114 TaxID=1227553 RepID=A0A511R2M1_9DEIN|nr:hypothetical protein MHY01S_20240 [Meiothermus hypogaeus NBRC 106114]
MVPPVEGPLPVVHPLAGPQGPAQLGLGRQDGTPPAPRPQTSVESVGPVRKAEARG